MRIIFLTILFAGIFKVFSSPEENPDKIDSIKIKLSAPKRLNRSPAVLPFTKVDVPLPEASSHGFAQAEEQRIEDQSEHFTSGVANTEDIWLTELRELLLRLEPIDGDEIFNTYKLQHDSYQSEMDSLIGEKQQKSTDDAVTEMEQQISALDAKHEEKLKVIFGIHYDTIKENHEEFMLSNPDEHEE